METKVQQAVNKNKLSISRIPAWAKEVIVGRADEEFCGDYGMCVAQLVRESNEYDCLKRKFFDGSIKAKLITDEHGEEKSNDEIKTANGKIIKMEVKQNE